MRTRSLAVAHIVCAFRWISLPKNTKLAVALTFAFLVGHSIGEADSPDVTELLPEREIFEGETVGVFADVDGDSSLETFVVFKAVEGVAVSLPDYQPSYDTGSQVYNFRGISVIRFVNTLAPGFRSEDASTWTYRSVDGVRLVARLDSSWFEARAYSGLNGSGSVVGSCASTNASPAATPTTLNLEFARPGAVKEIELRTEWHAFSSADITLLVIRSTGIDIGLRAFDGSEVVRLACDPGEHLTSPLRIRKDGAIYGVLLTPTNSPAASRFLVQTTSGIKGLRRLP